MSETIEALSQYRTIAEIFADIEAAEPKPIAASVPANVEEEKERFLSGEIENPQFIYDTLEVYDFVTQAQKLLDLKQEILSHPDLNPRHIPVYEAFIDRHLKVLLLMKIANEHNHSEDDAEKRELAEHFKALNIELYGDVDKVTFNGLIAEKINKITSKKLSASAQLIRAELVGILSNDVTETDRFIPTAGTVAFAKELAESLYGNMLSYVDGSKESYSPQEIREVFESIIAGEFGEVAKDWKVIVAKASSINVVASERIIKIPTDRKPVSLQELKGLIAHELGVHFLRAIMGEQTDLYPLRLGFAGYYDSEEGLGKVMEQAVKGKYADTGIPYYIATGLISQGRSFRETYEIMWRIHLLEKTDSNSEVNEKEKADAQDNIFKTILRVARLTNGLAWHKDLSYYNGSILQWKYIQDNLGDFEKIMALFYGKSDPTIPEHERLAYEAKSIN